MSSQNEQSAFQEKKENIRAIAEETFDFFERKGLSVAEIYQVMNYMQSEGSLGIIAQLEKVPSSRRSSSVIKISYLRVHNGNITG